ncbi:MAG: tetratricopeptide repeat protein [Bdellovibrionales bacterium]|nr:tetratricopeptide repeat protein [Bdellovibrionales bacterium]
MRISCLTLVFILLLSGCATESMRERASSLRKNKDYENAIAAYQKHIQARLAVSDKPEWENPYIYYLDIGDIYLEQSKLKQALEYYELAEKQGVKPGYVNDRYRFVARWLEDRGQLAEAIAHLEKYREKDPMLFDLVLDRLARKLVAEPSQARPAGNPELTPSPMPTIQED